MPASLGSLLETALRHRVLALPSAALRYPHLFGELLVRLPGPVRERYYGWRDSRRVLAAAGPTGKILFVDGGAHLGGGFAFFSRYFPPGRVEYELFEPNPNCHARLERRLAGYDEAAVRLRPVALSTRSGSAPLYGLAADEGGPLSEGASLVRHQHSIFYEADPEAAPAVPTIDFCAYIGSQRARYDVLVVKLDVEGAEYELLEALIEQELLDCIDTLYVEFHAFYLKPAQRRSELQREARLIARLRASGTRLRIWH